MKKIYPLLYFLFLLSGIQAQHVLTVSESETYLPPKAIEEKFKKQYPNITPKWRMEEKLYIAEFTDTVSIKGMAIGYDEKGSILRRENEMENSSYPRNINTYFVKNYPGEKFKTWKSKDVNGNERYCIKRESGTVWFDKEGNYIDPEKKKEENTLVNSN